MRKTRSETLEQRLTALREKIGAAGVRQREADTRLAEVRAGLESLRAEQVRALAEEDEGRASKLAGEITKAQRVLDDDVTPRVRGAELAVSTATMEVDAFIAQNHDPLAVERAEGDERVTIELEEAARHLLDAAGRWSGRQAEAIALAGKAPNADARRVRDLDLGNAPRDLRRVLAQGDLPRPNLLGRGSVAAWKIEDVDSWDDDVRETARVRVQAADAARDPRSAA